MADIFSTSKRSEIMKSIRSKDTGCELSVRKMIFAMGYRYRLHREDIPGKPDIVFPGFKKVIFVHGCFWHGHSQCSRGKRPDSNIFFWEKKIAANKVRDGNVLRKLRNLGWRSLIVWQCQIKQKNAEILKQKIKDFLED